MTLSERLRESTRNLHTEAERAGIMPALLRGALPLAGYLALLQQLLPVYAALEQALLAPSAPAFEPALMRRAALQADIDHLSSQPVAGPGPARLLPETLAFVAHLQRLPTPLLAAHGYVRYLGDLAGGQVLARVVGRAYGLTGDGLRFYRFEDEPAALAMRLRAVLDGLPAETHDAIVEEAQSAFRRHRRLFEALATD